MFDRKAVRHFTLFDQLLVGRKDIGPVTGDDVVDLLRYFVAEQRPFGLLVPLLRLDLTLGINLRTLAAGGDASVDRGKPFARYFGSLTEENHTESFSFHTVRFWVTKLRLQYRNGLE